jgi:hypothetical protein
MTAQTTGIKLDLNLNFANTFEPVLEESFTATMGDMSQLGKKRGELLPHQQIPLFEDQIIVIDDPAAISHGLIQKIFRKPVNTIEKPILRLEIGINSTGLNHRDLTGQQIVALREAIKPKSIDVMKVVAKDERIKDFIKDLGKRLDSDYATILATVNVRLATVPSLRTALMTANIIDVEEGTVTDATEITMTYEGLSKLDYVKTLSLKLAIGEIDERTQAAFDRVLFFKQAVENEVDESILSNPIIEGLVSVIYSEVSTKLYEVPDFLPGITALGSMYKYVVVILNVVHRVGENEQYTKVVVNDDNSLLATELALWATMHKHSSHPNPSHNYEVAFTRLMSIRHGLIMGSTELCLFKSVKGLSLNADAITWYVNSYRKPEIYYAGLYISAISFLKSGHHANAFGIDNWVSKIAGALGIVIDQTTAQRYVNSIVYWGAHPANMLLLVNFLNMNAKMEKISGSITYRMHPVPPMFAAYCNLEVFIDALALTGFFTYTGKQKDYDVFKANMRTIKSQMHFCAPYAYYLYGESHDDPIGAKQVVGSFAAYAMAIDTVLPRGTLNLSPALRKLADNEGRNTIAAQLQVEAFVRAYRQFHAQLITANLLKSIGGRRRLELE